MKRRLCIVFAVLAVLTIFWYVEASSWTSSTTRSLSPDGRYEVVRATETDRWGEHFTTLWICEARELQRNKWHRIAPRVQGTWMTDWRGENQLVVTDYGSWPHNAEPYGVHQWRDVRIETRARPRSRVFKSPDSSHVVTVWRGQDSRGPWSSATIQTDTVPMNDAGDDYCKLIDEGVWDIHVKWLADDRLSIEVTPRGDQPLPVVRQEWCGVAISSRGIDRSTR